MSPLGVFFSHTRTRALSCRSQCELTTKKKEKKTERKKERERERKKEEQEQEQERMTIVVFGCPLNADAAAVVNTRH